MPGDATSAADDIRPRVFAGFPVSSWAFALRVLLAMLLALYVSFWLELESPSSAAVTVAILALPTRAQGMEKAGYRLLATAIGVIASIAIAGTFSQTGALLPAVLGIWVGLCVYVAGMLDGNRAYAAALSCITVALIAIQQIDSPLQVFPTGSPGRRHRHRRPRGRSGQRGARRAGLSSGSGEPPRNTASPGHGVRATRRPR